MNRKPNFRALEWAEYRGFRYEPDSNGRVCVFNRYTEYLNAFETTEEADDFVDKLLAEEAAKK